MKKSKIFSSLLVLMAFFAMSALINLAQAATLNKAAVLTKVVGQVEVQRGGTGEWALATENMKVYGGDNVRTQGQASCVISWDGGNVVKLSSFTSFAIQDISVDLASKSTTSSFEVASGNIYAKAKELTDPGSSFNVATPAAVAGVRGTTFGTGVAAGNATFTCPDGDVFIEGTAGGQQMCKTGTFVVVTQGKPPEEAKAITQEMMLEFNKEAEELEYPALQVISPAADGETAEAALMVSFTTNPGNMATVNGATVNVSATGAGQSTVNLAEGENEIKIVVTNDNGKSSFATYKIAYKKAVAAAEGALFVKVANPQNGSEVATDTITIEGETNGKSVTVNGGMVTVDATGKFSASVMLEKDENNITVSATDENNNSEQVTVQVFYYPDLEPCDVFITVVSPTGEDPTKNKSIEFSAIVPEGAEVDVGGTMLMAPSGSVNANLNLFMEGENNFIATARLKRDDCLENSASMDFSVFLDTMPPNITMSRPQQGFIPNGESVEIVMNVNDATDIVRLEINQIDVTGDLDEAGFFKRELIIKKDVNALAIRATDAVGNMGEVTITRGTLDNIDATSIGIGSIRVVPSPPILTAGDTATIEVYVGSLEGQPAPANIPIALFATRGRFEPPGTMTDGVRGVSEPFKFQYFSPTTVLLGTADEMATGALIVPITAEVLSRSGSAQIQVLPAGGLPIILTASEMELAADGRAATSVAASVSVGGRPAAGLPITFRVSANLLGVPYGVFDASGVATVTKNTDENGVAIARFIAGRQNGLASITATAPNAAPGYLPIVLNDAGQATEGSVNIRGRVIDSAGVGLPNTEVIAILQSATRVWSSFPAITGPDGYFTIINVPVGNILLEAHSTAGFGTSSLMIAEQGVTVTAPDITISSILD